MRSIRSRGAAFALIMGLAVSGASAFGPGPSDPAELEAFIDGLIAGQMKAYHIAGAVFSLVKEGKVMMAKGYGLADVDGRRAPSAETTLFRCASISKLVTWTAVMQLVEEGKLDLKSDIGRYLPEPAIPKTFPEPITLEHLMAHSAGFEDLASGIGTLDERGLLPLDVYLKTYLPRRIYPPGRVTAYSNYSTALAGAVVARVSGMSFEDYVERRIFEPLAMSRTTFRQPLPPALAGDVSKGYRYDQGAFRPEDFEYINVGPAGAMSSTAGDMARFMIAHLQNGEYEGRRIFGQETARRMHERHFGNDPRVTGNAHGFWERRLNGLRWISHGGDTLLFHSYLILCPEQNIGFFVSFNTITGAGNAREELLQAVLDRYYPQDDLPEPAPNPAFKERARPLEGVYGLSRTAVSNYEKAQDLLLNIRVKATREGTLLTSLPFGLGARQWRPVEKLVFREVGGQDRLVFAVDERGEVTGAFLDSNPLFGLVKRPWYRSPALHWASAGAAALLFLSALLWPLGAVVRFLFREPAGGARKSWLLRLPALLMSLLFLGFIAGLAGALSRPETIMVGAPALLKQARVLALAAFAALAAAAWAAVRAWRGKYWTRPGRVHYTLVVLAGAVFSAFLLYWKLLVFSP